MESAVQIIEALGWAAGPAIASVVTDEGYHPTREIESLRDRPTN